MDRFSEQLVEKYSDGKDKLTRALIIIGEIVLLGLLALICFVIPTVLMVCVAAAMGSFFLFKILMENTMHEYEYIVTNDDLDIDKIIGRKKRKRLITVSLRTTEEIGVYDGSELRSDVTVMAHDNTGEDLWYLIANTEKYGRVALLFNPNKKTVINIVGGLEPKLRMKYTEELGLKETDEASEE